MYFLVGCIVFCISHTQHILYHSNQNTKFLHGLANAGHGFLENDWLSNTWDPLLVFTTIVQFTYEYLSPSFFYIYYYVIISLYFVFVVKIVAEIFNIKLKSFVMLAFVAVFVLVHSELFHQLSVKFLGISLRRLFTFGFAFQYMFNHYFQPSVFGVLLIISLYYFIKKKYFVAVLFSSLAMVFHSAYFLHAALLTIVYMGYAYAENKRILKSIYIGLLSLIIVLPVVINSMQHFESVSPELQFQAREIVIDYIIPFHSIPANWLSAGEIFKMIVTMGAIILFRKTRISTVILVFFGIGMFFTVLDFVYPNNTIRFMAPWRLSIIFYPLSFILVAAYGVKNAMNLRQAKRIITIMSVLLLVSTTVFGIIYQRQKLVNHENRVFSSMMNFIRGNKEPGDLYFIPPYIDDFRLYTGAAIFINSKSHPYRSEEIIEWFNREQVAKRFYQDKLIELQELEDLVYAYNITHVVLHQEQALLRNPKSDTIELKKVYEDDVYVVYEIIRDPS
jgi:hypothetical protein